jgi:hypothetical protein
VTVRWSTGLVLTTLAAGSFSMPAASQGPRDVQALITRVGARVADYYRRARSLICVETSIVQPIRGNWSPEGLPRTVESELRLDLDATDGDTLPEPNVVRQVRRINGRAPKERDKTDREGCTDPNLLSAEPLAFLLPQHRDAHRFTSVREGKDRNRAALIVDFVSANRTSRPELIQDERGHDDCFDWSGPVAARGRVWVDALTYDVLRVERHVDGPVDIRVPLALQRRYGLGPWVVLDQDDLTLHYKPVTFSDPEEVVLLPSSIESVNVLRGGLQSVRRTDQFSSYRRFLTRGRIEK